MLTAWRALLDRTESVVPIQDLNRGKRWYCFTVAHMSCKYTISQYSKEQLSCHVQKMSYIYLCHVCVYPTSFLFMHILSWIHLKCPTPSTQQQSYVSDIKATSLSFFCLLVLIKKQRRLTVCVLILASLPGVWPISASRLHPFL